MVKVGQKKPFSDEDIASFQIRTDEWYQMWMTLEGREGCTNYTHVLGLGRSTTGTFTYSPTGAGRRQTWTARGGGRQASSRLLPITCWLQRMLVFMAVTDEADLKNKLEELLAPDPTAEPDEEHLPMEEEEEEEEEDAIFETMWL